MTVIPYISDEQADAATKNPHLKLVFRLISFYILDEGSRAFPLADTSNSFPPTDADELEWFVPAAILPTELRRSLNVINQFLETPLDLDGKKAKELLSKKTRRRRRVRRSPSVSDSDADSDEPVQKKKREKKKKEKEVYKSAQFIEDSDGEYGDMGAFLEKEKELRERTAKAARESGKIGTMKATGTKKRKRGATKMRKKWEGEPDPAAEAKKQLDSDNDSDIGIIGELEADDEPIVIAQTKPRPKPRPRPRPRAKQSSDVSSPVRNSDATGPPISSDVEVDTPKEPMPIDSVGNEGRSSLGTGTKRKSRIVISDDEE